jgi:aconitate hydratase
MLELEAFELKKKKPEIAVHVDHNLLQTDYKNMDDHLLQSAAARFDSGLADLETELATWYTWNVLADPAKHSCSDSHTPAGGGIGMLAIGTGGLDVALAAAGEPYYVKMPKLWASN